MEMVDMGRLDEAVHRGVDAGGGAWRAEDAVVEELVHLVLVLLAPIHIVQSSDAIETQDRQTLSGECAQVTTRALDPHHLEVAGGRRV
jgi:hypothetical protein